jgi:uncharacterized membrane protein YtjA (UPF0391 family)
LTGFIPQHRQVGFRDPSATLFLENPKISRFNGQEPAFSGRIVSAVAARRSQPCRLRQKTEDRIMLSWVVTFLIVALIAGILGFGGVAGVSIEIAKTIFFIAVILFLVSAVVGLARGRTRV